MGAFFSGLYVLWRGHTGRFFLSVFLQKVQIEGLIQLGGDIAAVFLSLLDAFRQQVFDLTVDAAEVVLCPFSKIRVESR